MTFSNASGNASILILIINVSKTVKYYSGVI